MDDPEGSKYSLLHIISRILLNPGPVPTPIRTVNGRGPVTDVTSQYIACGNQAKVVSEEALVDAGGTIEIRWSPSVRILVEPSCP